MTSIASHHGAALPEPLPEGETVLWHGKPSGRSLALRAFHVRKIGLYFCLIAVLRASMGLYEQLPLPAVGRLAAPVILLGLAAMTISALLALLYARTTTYTITSRRVIMRFGAALPMTVNIPFGIIGLAAAKVHNDETADIPLKLTGTGRVSYLHLWPHARPWHLTHPEPMLRSLPEGARVAALLASALVSAPPPAVQAAAIQPSVPASTNGNVPLSGILTPAAA